MMDRESFSNHAQRARQDELAIEAIDVRDTQRLEEAGINDPELYLEGYRPSRVDYNRHAKGRCVSDKHTWTIPLNIDGVEPSTTPKHLITRATLRMHPVTHPNPDADAVTWSFLPAYYQLSTQVVSAPCLKYQYLTIPCKHNMQAVHVCPERYRNISALQIESMDVKDRPPGYTTLLAAGFEKSWQGLAGSGYEVPKYWKYYDDKVEEILRARWDKA